MDPKLREILGTAIKETNASMSAFTPDVVAELYRIASDMFIAAVGVKNGNGGVAAAAPPWSLEAPTTSDPEIWSMRRILDFLRERVVAAGGGKRELSRLQRNDLGFLYNHVIGANRGRLSGRIPSAQIAAMLADIDKRIVYVDARGDLKPVMVGSTWKHRNGIEYTVTGIVDEMDTPDYPARILFRSRFGKGYTKEFVDWHRSMIHVADPEYTIDKKIIAFPKDDENVLSNALQKRTGPR